MTASVQLAEREGLHFLNQRYGRSLGDAVTSSQKSLALANKLYSNGLTDFLHVLDAERSLYQAQDALVQSDRTVSSDLISLYKSLGGGWETVEKQSSLALAQATTPAK